MVMILNLKERADLARDFAFEVKAEEIEVLAKAIHPLPVDPIGRVESNIDTRLNHRALDMRNQKTSSIFKLRHYVLQALRKTLVEKKFIEITTPKIIGSASEGGADLFSLDYFDESKTSKLYLNNIGINDLNEKEISKFRDIKQLHSLNL